MYGIQFLQLTNILNLIVGAVSFYFTDVESESALYSVMLPVIDVIALTSLAVWFVALFHKLGIKQTYTSTSDGSSTGVGVDVGGGEGGM